MTTESLIKNIELSLKFLQQSSHFHELNCLKVHTSEMVSGFMIGGLLCSNSAISIWHLLHMTLFGFEDSSFP